MDAAAASACHSCGAPVSKDELVQGLAVRIDGNLVCPLCVDGLPGEAQVKINRVRALRGLNAVTYRVPRAGHPRLAAYTFTTAANLVVHRRQVAESGRFEAPILPAASERAAAARAPVAAVPRAGARPKRPLLAITAVAAVALVGIGVAVVAAGGREAPRSEPANALASTPPSERVAKQRLDYPSSAARAWEEAAADPDCPAEVRQAIASELITERSRVLDEAERALQAGDRERVEALLSGEELPAHVLFTALRQRADTLARRSAAPDPAPPAPPSNQAPAVASPTPSVPAVAPPPAPSATPVATPAPVTRPTPPAAAPLTPPTAGTPGSTDRLLIAIAELAEAPGRDDWKASRGLRVLATDTGTLARTLALAGGRYQVWVRARAGETAGSVQVVLGDQRTAPIAVPPARSPSWQRVAASIELPPGPCRLQLVAIGLGLAVDELYLAGTGLGEPSSTDPAGSAPTWLPDVPPPAAPPAPVTMAGPWSPRFVETHAAVDPIDPASRIPAGLPGGVGTIHESTAKGRKKHGFSLDLTGVDTAGGGLALLLHPVRPDRTKLQITLVDADGRRHPLPMTAVDPTRWNTILVPAAASAGQIDGDRLKMVTVEDADALTTSFLLAKVAVAKGVPPSEAALELRAPALLPLAYADLERALAGVALKRRSRNWRRDFDPALLKVLIGHQLLMGEWDTMARKGLADVLREPLKNDELPARTLQEFVMQDAWLDALFDPPPDKPAVLDPAKHHLVILCTAGVEFPIGLTEPQAFMNLWTKLIDKCIERGVLPVTVLGPNKVNAADVAEVEQLWIHVEGWLRKNRPGLPIIDLRPAKAVSYQRFAPGMAQLSVRLLVDGYGELYRRILALKKATK